MKFVSKLNIFCLFVFKKKGKCIFVEMDDKMILGLFVLEIYMWYFDYVEEKNWIECFRC